MKTNTSAQGTAGKGTLRVTSDREFSIEHTFDAPAARVFAAYTDPKLVPQWWAPRWSGSGGSFQVERMDVRPGGQWRFRVKFAGDRPEMVFHGVYKEVDPVTRLAYTFNVEGQPNPEILATVVLAERGGKTHLTLTNRCASKEQLDGMLQYGAEQGAQAAWAQLDALLARSGA
jgi:uncharacterized protein YndB with AHSA1/START domain